MNRNMGWLTAAELGDLIGPAGVEIVRRGIESGLFQGMIQAVDGELRFAPDTAPFVAWSSRLADDVLSGHISVTTAGDLLWRRARQLRRRIAREARSLAAPQSPSPK